MYISRISHHYIFNLFISALIYAYALFAVLWSNSNTSNWNTYLKCIICNLDFVLYLLSKCILYFVAYFNYIFQCNLRLKYNLGQTQKKSNLPAMNGCTMLRYVQPQPQNLWVKKLRYLSVHILQSRTSKCSLSNHRKTVYRLANAIFGRLASSYPRM